MRSLITSSVILAVMIICWLWFYTYSDKELHSMTNEIKSSIIINVESENFGKAYDEIRALEKRWHKYKKNATLILDTSAINETDYTFAKSEKYIKAKDVSNSSGELSCLIEQLRFLHANESLNLSNIL